MALIHLHCLPQAFPRLRTFMLRQSLNSLEQILWFTGHHLELNSSTRSTSTNPTSSTPFTTKTTSTFSSEKLQSSTSTAGNESTQGLPVSARMTREALTSLGITGLHLWRLDSTAASLVTSPSILTKFVSILSLDWLHSCSSRSFFSDGSHLCSPEYLFSLFCYSCDDDSPVDSIFSCVSALSRFSRRLILLCISLVLFPYIFVLLRSLHQRQKQLLTLPLNLFFSTVPGQFVLVCCCWSSSILVCRPSFLALFLAHVLCSRCISQVSFPLLFVVLLLIFLSFSWVTKNQMKKSIPSCLRRLSLTWLLFWLSNSSLVSYCCISSSDLLSLMSHWVDQKDNRQGRPKEMPKECLPHVLPPRPPHYFLLNRYYYYFCLFSLVSPCLFHPNYLLWLSIFSPSIIISFLSLPLLLSREEWMKEKRT